MYVAADLMVMATVDFHMVQPDGSYEPAGETWKSLCVDDGPEAWVRRRRTARVSCPSSPTTAISPLVADYQARPARH